MKKAKVIIGIILFVIALCLASKSDYNTDTIAEMKNNGSYEKIYKVLGDSASESDVIKYYDEHKGAY